MTHDPVFIDTSGWIAMLNSDDEYHPLAGELLRSFDQTRRTLVSTDWVVPESGNGLARTLVRSIFPSAIRQFQGSQNARLIRVDTELFDRAVEIYARTSDKTWGLVDCASFVVMRDFSITEALSTDRHFKQAGFNPLLLPS